MVLGGNVPDKYIEHVLLDATKDASLSNDNRSDASTDNLDSNNMQESEATPSVETSDSKSKAA